MQLRTTVKTVEIAEVCNSWRYLTDKKDGSKTIIPLVYSAFFLLLFFSTLETPNGVMDNFYESHLMYALKILFSLKGHYTHLH